MNGGTDIEMFKEILRYQNPESTYSYSWGYICALQYNYFSKQRA